MKPAADPDLQITFELHFIEIERVQILKSLRAMEQALIRIHEILEKRM